MISAVMFSVISAVVSVMVSVVVFTVVSAVISIMVSVVVFTVVSAVISIMISVVVFPITTAVIFAMVFSITPGSIHNCFSVCGIHTFTLLLANCVTKGVRLILTGNILYYIDLALTSSTVCKVTLVWGV